MLNPKTQLDATLLDILIDGFEKNEMLEGFHWRELPMPDPHSARQEFTALVDETIRWKGRPVRTETGGERAIAAWPDLEIRHAGRGILVRVRAPNLTWWCDEQTWRGDPMGPVHDWTIEERRGGGD